MKREARGNEKTCGYTIKSDDLAITLAIYICFLVISNGQQQQRAKLAP